MTDPIEAIITQLREVQDQLSRLSIVIDPSKAGDLTQIELTVLLKTAQGYSAKEISSQTGRTHASVVASKRRILLKMRARSMSQAVFLGCRKGLIK